MSIEHTVRLGGQTAPDQLELQIRDTDPRPVVLINLPNPITIGVWNGCSEATLVTDTEPEPLPAETDGDIRFDDGRLLSQAGAVDWPPGDPNPEGMEPTDPEYQPPEIFDAVNRDPVSETFDLATGEAPGESDKQEA